MAVGYDGVCKSNIAVVLESGAKNIRQVLHVRVSRPGQFVILTKNLDVRNGVLSRKEIDGTNGCRLLGYIKELKAGRDENILDTLFLGQQVTHHRLCFRNAD